MRINLMKTLFTLVFALSLQAPLHATEVDTLLLVDVTGGMSSEINTLKSPGILASYHTRLLGFGHDPRYGLVTFDGSATLVQDLTDFATFTAGGGAFASLTTGAGTSENGALAVSTAAGASIRAGAYVNLVLLTDEPGDWSPGEAAAAVAAAQALNATFQPNVSDASPANYTALTAQIGSLDGMGNPTAWNLSGGSYGVLFDQILPFALEQRIQAGVPPSPVPVPAAVWLLLSALAVLRGRRRANGPNARLLASHPR